jgi:iron complex outermembrane receptor protein
VSKGFLLNRALTPAGQINTDLQPEIGWNYDSGERGLNNKLYTEISFSTQISNLLVARRTADDQYIGINAGKVRI